LEHAHSSYHVTYLMASLAGLLFAAAAGATSAPSTAAAIADGFWAGGDEWSDVRSALMDIGIDASLDEEDDEDVWALEAGRVKTRRCAHSQQLLTLAKCVGCCIVVWLGRCARRTWGWDVRQGSQVGARGA
jgi:hypothetical protein